MKLNAVSRRSRGSLARAVGLAVLALAGLAVTGCGLGPGEETGDASLLVTRDYGSAVMVDEPAIPVNESSDAMRILDGKAELETAYGGGFVQAIDGFEGKDQGGRAFDWFYSVNGVVAERGSVDYPVSGGDRVWWDYRDWTDSMMVGAVVGAFPAPFSTSYGDESWGVGIDCLGEQRTCDLVQAQLEKFDVELSGKDEDMMLRVGTWDQISGTPEGRRLARGPAQSGVFARFNAGVTGTPPLEQPAPWRLVGLDVKGEDARDYGPEAGLVAAMRRGEKPPVWLITGGTDDAVRLAAAALDPDYLKRRYAAAVSDGVVTSLPAP